MDILNKGNIKKQDITLLYRGNGLNKFKEPLFKTVEGIEIYQGDTVEFFTDTSRVFPSSGVVSNINGMKINCFNTLLNKWETYLIE